MASLYPRERSPYWWIEYIDADVQRRQESTKLRCDVPAQTRQARQLRDDLTTREIGARLPTRDGLEAWAAWVPRFIAQRYGGKILTRIRAEEAWKNVAAFLEAENVTVPRQLNRQQVRHFIEWRQVRHLESGTRKGAKNTALLEIKFLALVVDEAIACGFCSSNPCHRLGIGREEPKRKPQILPEEHRFITRSLKRKPEWMRVSYKIAWEQGCRFSESCFALDNVNLAANTLRLRTKGKKESAVEVPISPRLRPLFRRLIRQKREVTFQMPRAAGKQWSNFFREIGLSHLSFHCTRVSFITRCYEAGIPEPDVMRLVLHASTTVHRIYPRLPAASRHLQEAMKRAAA